MKPWLTELAADLKNLDASPWFLLRACEHGVYAAKRLPMPRVGDPNLLYFPAPFPALEALAALRGFGGVRHGNPGLPQSRAADVCEVRQCRSPVAAYSKLGAYLFMSPARALLASHLLVPFADYGGTDAERAAVAMARLGLYEAVGFTARAARRAARSAGQLPVPDFWAIVRAEGGIL